MDGIELSPDDFKPPHDVCFPDRRSGYKGVLIDLPRDFADAIERHHGQFEELRLNSAVPEAVQIQFATAKNLCLYAWFVFRFYPVAEHQALTCLEFALHSRFPERLPKQYWNKYPKQEPTLHPLLRYAIDTGVLQNAGFSRWHNHAAMRARQRYEHERLHEMIDRGLNEIELDFDQIVVAEPDYDWDLLSVLKETLPKTRNFHAHGTTMLHNKAYGTLELVAEIINQLFPEVVVTA